MAQKRPTINRAQIASMLKNSAKMIPLTLAAQHEDAVDVASGTDVFLHGVGKSRRKRGNKEKTEGESARGFQAGHG